MNIKQKIVGTLVGAGLLFSATPAFAYDVVKGDTMNEIAAENNMSLGELSAINPQVKNVNLIYIGQTINTNKDNKQSQPVKTAAKSVETKTVTKAPVLNNEIDLLARIVRAEAENEPYSGKVAVASVVLNRVDSSEFPNSISSVIYQPGQFDPVRSGSINRPADTESKRAAVEATHNRNTSALFFYNPRTAGSRWLDSRPTVTSIGNHVFKR